MLATQGNGLFLALVIGVGFGWFLERGGLGNARKLAGQFYFTDLTVFKVMFSAIITAALGLFWLSRLGVVELSQIYLPPTYILPQLAGGVVFGVGFVMGGLCPGTSCVAMSSGRLDGLALVGGMLGGVLIFNELFPILEPFYRSTPRGDFTLPTLLGIAPGTAVFFLVALGVAGFVAVGRFEAIRASRK